MLVSDSFTWVGSINQEVLSQKAWMNQFRCRMLCERVRAAESLMQSSAIARMRCEIARCIAQFVGLRFCFVTKNTRFSVTKRTNVLQLLSKTNYITLSCGTLYSTKHTVTLNRETLHVLATFILLCFSVVNCKKSTKLLTKKARKVKSLILLLCADLSLKSRIITKSTCEMWRQE